MGGDGRVTTYFKDDADISLEDLVRQERVHGARDDYNANLQQHILKQGGSYHAVNVDEEDEELRLGEFEAKRRPGGDHKGKGKGGDEAAEEVPSHLYDGDDERERPVG